MRLTRPSLYTSVPVTNESQDLPGKSHSCKNFIRRLCGKFSIVFCVYYVEMSKCRTPNDSDFSDCT